MIVQKGVPLKEIRELKCGDFYIDGEIVSIRKGERIISIITSAGSLYNAHAKTGDYSVFKIKREGRNREGKREEKKEKQRQRKAERLKAALGDAPDKGPGTEDNPADGQNSGESGGAES